MIRAPALLFDLDETLVVDEPAAVEAFRATAAAADGLDAEALALAARTRARELWHAGPLYAWAKGIGIASWEALWGSFEGQGRELAALREWVPGFRLAAWATALADLGVVDDALAGELVERFGAERRARMATYPEAPGVLAALAERHPLGLVTNGLPALQREKLAASGLEPCFGAVVVSGELGVGKPDPSVFAAALDGLGAPADGAVMVGDSLARDVDGALAAGLRPVWIARDGAAAGRDGVPRIRTLAELPALL